METETFRQNIRENRGLQNVGLLVLDSQNGSVKRDTWTSSFRDVISALDYPQQVGEPPVVTQPDVIPGGQVHIPDPNLRAAVAEALGKRSNAPITVEEMKGVRNLHVQNKGIRDLTGLQFATNLRELWAHGNNLLSDLSPLRGLTNLTELGFDHSQVSDISPVAGLINLRHLGFRNTNVSDVSPLAGLINLTFLGFPDNQIPDISSVRGLTNLETLRIEQTLVSDISPVRRLTNLVDLRFHNTLVSDISPVAGLTELEELHLHRNSISDISPIAGLTNLKRLDLSFIDILSDISPLATLSNLEWLSLRNNNISDISALARLTNLTYMDLARNEISDVSPLATLSNLEWLNLRNNNISDISALARLTNLTYMDLSENAISDVSPLATLSNLKRLELLDNNISDISALARLTNLTSLNVSENAISNLSPLDGLRPNLDFLSVYDNPGFPQGGPKIDGPWLWLLLPGAKLPSGKDLLTEASGGTVTELTVATHGATAGQSVGDSTWTLNTLPHQRKYNITDMLKDSIRDGTIYGFLSLYSPREQETMIYVGSLNSVKVWLNGVLVHQIIDWRDPDDYTDAVPVTLKPGRNVLLVAVAILAEDGYGFFGFKPGTEYAVASGIGYAFSQSPIHIGDTFEFDVRAENVSDLAGWQFDIAFDPAALEAINVSEGDFLKTDGGTTFFQSGRIDNTAGKITGLIAGRISEGGVSGSGSVLQVRFKAKSESETELALGNFEFGSNTGENIPASPLEIRITVEERLLTGDVNRDGRVSILDLIRVARQLGKRVSADSAVDINGDGVVNIFDLTLVAQGIGGAAAPASSGH